MNSKELFQLALQLPEPWFVEEIRFKENSSNDQELHIQIGYQKGYKFEPDSTIHDRVIRSWRHLNFFQHECYLHCKVPRIKTSSGEIKTVNVPWARKGSGFTLMFEAYTLAMIEREMPVNKVAELVKEYAQRLWKIFNYWIGRAYNQDDQSRVEQLGIDETSVRKGHNYITVAADLSTRRVIHVTEGRDSEAVGKVKEHLENKGVEPKKIKDACIDMSTGYIKGMNKYFPDTNITFDRFHVVKMLNESFDKIRKMEAKEHNILKGHKYTFLKSNSRLSEFQKQERDQLIELLPTLGEAYRLKVLFNDFWSMKDKQEASAFLIYWCDVVEERKIWGYLDFVKTLKTHLGGITNYVESQIANGVIEGINNKIQLAKRRARGYRNIQNFINMIYFIAGKLKFDYPLYIT